VSPMVLPRWTCQERDLLLEAALVARELAGVFPDAERTADQVHQTIRGALPASVSEDALARLRDETLASTNVDSYVDTYGADAAAENADGFFELVVTLARQRQQQAAVLGRAVDLLASL
jgi:hypothetical protein